MSEKKGEVHIHHHYAPVKKGSPSRRARRVAPNKKSRKKVFSVIINIIEELVRLA